MTGPLDKVLPVQPQEPHLSAGVWLASGKTPCSLLEELLGDSQK